MVTKKGSSSAAQISRHMERLESLRARRRARAGHFQEPLVFFFPGPLGIPGSIFWDPWDSKGSSKCPGGLSWAFFLAPWESDGDLFNALELAVGSPREPCSILQHPTGTCTCYIIIFSNLVPIVLRAHSYSFLDNCPTIRVNLTWYSDWNCQDLVSVSILVQCFQYPLVQRRMCCS